MSDTHAVSYIVTSSVPTSVLLTYETGTGQSQTTLPTPVTDTRVVLATGQVASMVAQNQSDVGTVYCVIAVDGHVLASNQSDGAYAVVSCAAPIPAVADGPALPADLTPAAPSAEPTRGPDDAFLRRIGIRPKGITAAQLVAAARAACAAAEHGRKADVLAAVVAAGIPKKEAFRVANSGLASYCVSWQSALDR